MASRVTAARRAVPVGGAFHLKGAMKNISRPGAAKPLLLAKCQTF
jgi:hypothetical protein